MPSTRNRSKSYTAKANQRRVCDNVPGKKVHNTKNKYRTVTGAVYKVAPCPVQIPQPFIAAPFPVRSLTPKSETTTSTCRRSAPVLALLLESCRDDGVRLEKLCGAAVEADGLALVEVAFAIVGWETLLCAHLDHAVRRSWLARRFCRYA